MEDVEDPVLGRWQAVAEFDMFRTIRFRTLELEA